MYANIIYTHCVVHSLVSRGPAGGGIPRYATNARNHCLACVHSDIFLFGYEMRKSSLKAEWDAQDCRRFASYPGHKFAQIRKGVYAYLSNYR